MKHELINVTTIQQILLSCSAQRISRDAVVFDERRASGPASHPRLFYTTAHWRRGANGSLQLLTGRVKIEWLSVLRRPKKFPAGVLSIVRKQDGVEGLAARAVFHVVARRFCASSYWWYIRQLSFLYLP